MNLTWTKCQGGQFCPLETVNLSSVETDGVYIIWHNSSAKVIYVGQGDIKERLTKHRSSPDILAHRGSGLLLVTWASVTDSEGRLRIERYLHKVYSPLASSCSYGPDEPVNLPQ
jgi:hypothetical protein